MTELTRRTLAKGVAWSLPVVAVGAAAPPAAASSTPEPILVDVCRVDAHNHGKGKPLQITIQDPPLHASFVWITYQHKVKGQERTGQVSAYWHDDTQAFVSDPVPNGVSNITVYWQALGGDTVGVHYEGPLRDCHARG